MVVVVVVWLSGRALALGQGSDTQQRSDSLEFPSGRMGEVHL